MLPQRTLAQPSRRLSALEPLPAAPPPQPTETIRFICACDIELGSESQRRRRRTLTFIARAKQVSSYVRVLFQPQRRLHRSRSTRTTTTTTTDEPICIFPLSNNGTAPGDDEEPSDFPVGGARLLPPSQPQGSPASAARRTSAPNQSKSVILARDEAAADGRTQDEHQQQQRQQVHLPPTQRPASPAQGDDFERCEQRKFANNKRKRRRRTRTTAATEREAILQCDTTNKKATSNKRKLQSLAKTRSNGAPGEWRRAPASAAGRRQGTAPRQKLAEEEQEKLQPPPPPPRRRSARKFAEPERRTNWSNACAISWRPLFAERRCIGSARLVAAALLVLFAALIFRASLNGGGSGGHLLFASSATALLQSSPTASGGDDSRPNEQLSKAILATMETPAPTDHSGHALHEQEGAWPQWQTTAVVPATNESRKQALPGEEIVANTPTTQGPANIERVLNFGRIFIMGAIIVGDICGNSLVILSVCRHTKLRVTTNWFVVSLACADILVALFAMTFNASVIISGKWLFNSWVCDFWNSCDVLASTASILHLCCISIDRYIAIMRPLDYPMKITTRRVVYALCGVWISSALLSYIPIFTGIYTTSDHIKWLEDHPDQCEFNVNRVYAVVSSSISFWIPCCIMVFTYYRIYREASRQEKFIYKAQSLMPAPMANHHSATSGGGGNSAARRSKQRRSKSVAVGGSGATSGGGGESRLKLIAKLGGGGGGRQSGAESTATTRLGAKAAPGALGPLAEKQPLASSALDINNAAGGGASPTGGSARQQQAAAANQEDADSNSGQSTPTKRSISKMKREHKAAKTLGIIMGVFILCWLPFFSWYTPRHICGKACDGMVPDWTVSLLFWIGYFNSTLNPIIYAYFNSEFREAFKKTLQWIFCCCSDLKCLRVNRPNDNQHYNCTYRSTQEIGLVA